MHAALKWAMNSDLNNFLTATFYQFVTVNDRDELALNVRRACQANRITGTVLIAEEGLNATVCGEPSDVHLLLAHLRRDPRFQGLEHKESFSEQRPLKRLKVKVKPEIITMRAPGVDAANHSGQYVEPQEWNDLISDPDVVVIDTRNAYEVSIGTFRNALDPRTSQFSDLPAWIDEQETLKDKPRVAMFCTGGIRCEKSTALLKSKGFENVYHLHGGILKYLEQVPQKDSLFEGECFVFDERVSVDHRLEKGQYEMCPSCGHPISEYDLSSPQFVDGACCPSCADTTGQ